MSGSTRGNGARSAAIVIGSLFLSLLILYAVRVNFMQPREPLVLDIPKIGVNVPSPRERIVRAPEFAGEFYPEDPEDLREAVREALSGGGSVEQEGDRPRIIIAPHAGYRYSGAIAGAAYGAMTGVQADRVIIVSRSHEDTFDHVAAADHDAWATPLGELPVDRGFVARLASSTSVVEADAAAHDAQQVIEVQLPFIQEVFGSEVRIVPLLFGNEDYGTVRALADALVPLMDDRTVIVASSDLSHYPNHEDAIALDGAITEAIIGSAGLDGLEKAFDDVLAGAERPPETLACSEPAIALAVEMARRFAFTGRSLSYANTGDVDPSEKEGVVGYAAIAFAGPLRGIAEAVLSSGKTLGEESRHYALAIARQSIVAAFERKNLELGDDFPAELMQRRGVFVSIKIGDELRGSMGTFEPDAPLGETIRRTALAAAFEDERFAPLTAAELGEARITVSVLSPLVRASDPSAIVLGTHGVLVRKGERTGVFLPQVATETGWDHETFFGELCEQKAGLPRECWQDPAVEIWMFAAQVISDGDEGGVMPPAEVIQSDEAVNSSLTL